MTSSEPQSSTTPPNPLITQLQRDRTRLVLAAVICFLLFHWAGKTFHLPYHLGKEDSLLQQASPMTSWIVTSVVWFAAVVLGTIVVGSIRFDAGLYVAALGMIALSTRGGTIRDIL